MKLGERTEDLQSESAATLTRNAHAGHSGLRLRFDSPVSRTRYLCALASLLFGASTKVTVVFHAGARRDDLAAEEVADRLARGAVDELRFEVTSGGHALPVEVAASTASDSDVVLHANFSSNQDVSHLWLQADADVAAPVAALALQTGSDGLAFDAAHAFAGLALRSGGFKTAELDGEHPIVWHATKPSDTARPVQSTLHDAVWTTSALISGKAELWVTGLPTPALHQPQAGWWERYDELTRNPKESLTELHALLAKHFEIPFVDFHLELSHLVR